MKAFSIIDIPVYQSRKLKKCENSMQIDYKRFNIRDRDLFESLFTTEVAWLIAWWKNWTQFTNITNSNVAYDREVAFLRVDTKNSESRLKVGQTWEKKVYSPRWIAHQIIAVAEWVWPIPFAYIEMYWKWQGLKWSVGRIDFYWAFFHFFEDVPVRYRNLYNKLQTLSRNDDKKVGVTRVDIAFDFFDFEYPQNSHLWINPAKQSKRSVEVRYHDKKINSTSYLAEKNSWYWVRIYNKSLQVMQSQKWNWYWGKEKIPENWTRIEFEFYNPYSSMDELELRKMCKLKVFWDSDFEIWHAPKPRFEFNVENAYRYLEKYAKNHWVTVEILLDECLKYHKYLQEIKENYWLVDEN